MKNNDERVGELLREWRITAPLPPRFSEQVWKRIECAEMPGVSVGEALRAWFTMAFDRPAFAYAYVTVLLIIGLTLGAVQASQQAARWEQQLQARYVQSVDPYQKGQP